MESCFESTMKTGETGRVYTATTRVHTIAPQSPDATTIHEAANTLLAGGLVAFPTETVYGLGANALDADAISRIFSAKERPANDPIIAHVCSLNQLDQVAVNVPELARQLAAAFWPGPLTLVLQRGDNIPANISAGRDTLAVRMPDHPVALALIQAAGVPVAAPSANRFARPSATTAQHVLDDLAGRVDIVLDAGPTTIGLESTVLDLTQDTPVVLRPGGISLEQLRPFIPDVHLKSKHLHTTDEPGASPGMLLKHYSPRAEVLLFSGEVEAVIDHMRRTATSLIAQGKRVGLMTPDDERPCFDDLSAHVVTLGADLEQISHNLFTRMRDLDALGVDVILVRGFERRGLGTAIWDRLLRAAEGQVIEVGDSRYQA
jgi:L-threonylcarbamoyladenylate synthase